MHVYTNLTDNKCAFFMFEEEKDDGSIVFKRLFYYKSKTKHNYGVFPMTGKVDDYISNVSKNKQRKAVICTGTTHGTDAYSDNFSISDVAEYIVISDMHPLIRHNVIKTLGCVFNSSGDLNFVEYDKYKKEVCKFPNVYIESKGGISDILPAYSRGKYNFLKNNR